MVLLSEEKEELEKIYQSYLNDERIQKMKDVIIHHGSNCYIHSFKVAKLAIKRGLRHNDVDLKTILLASILHDYYLYDRHRDKSVKIKHHMSTHPYVASKNAERDFHITKPVKEAIESHMWPFNFKNFPKSKEARIVSLADKTISNREMTTSKKHKIKKESEYLKFISSLF